MAFRRGCPDERATCNRAAGAAGRDWGASLDAGGMTWGAIALWAIVLICAAALSRLVRRVLWAFAAMAAILLALHAQAAPGEAAAGFAALAGGLVALRPLRRLAMAAGLGA